MDSLDLAAHDISVYRCQLWLDDYLWFASSDISAVSTTEGVIHNYALAYALNRFDRAVVRSTSPDYESDLAEMTKYPTPASAERIQRTSLTFNAIDTATYQTESPGISRRVTPKIGTRRVINPTLSVRQSYKFYAFVRDQEAIPRVIRLGKKRSPAHLIASEVDDPSPTYRDKTVRVGHIVNPLDTKARPERYSVISIPPHLLLDQASLSEGWTFYDRQWKSHVLVPDRVRSWAGCGPDGSD